VVEEEEHLVRVRVRVRVRVKVRVRVRVGVRVRKRSTVRMIAGAMATKMAHTGQSSGLTSHESRPLVVSNESGTWLGLGLGLGLGVALVVSNESGACARGRAERAPRAAWRLLAATLCGSGCTRGASAVQVQARCRRGAGAVHARCTRGARAVGHAPRAWRWSCWSCPGPRTWASAGSCRPCRALRRRRPPRPSRRSPR